MFDIFGTGNSGSTGSGSGTSSSGSGSGTSTGLNAGGILALLGQAESLLKAIFPGFSLKSNGFTQMQEVLGEKYMYHVLGVDIHDRNLVPADRIAEATQIMPMLFGVPLYDILDVNALEVSVQEYQKSPRAQGVPVEAIERAVMLKKNHFPYSKRLWNVKDAQQYPLVGYDRAPGGNPVTGGTGTSNQNVAGSGKTGAIMLVAGIFIAALVSVIAFLSRVNKKRRY